MYSSLAASQNIINTQELHQINAELVHGKNRRLSCESIYKVARSRATVVCRWKKQKSSWFLPNADQSDLV